MRAAPGDVYQRFSGAPSMSEVLNENTVEHWVKHGKSGGDEKEAHLNLSTMILADPGTTIKGEDLYNIIQEAKATEVTITSLLPKLKNASIETTVTPGPGVVEQTPRTGRKRRAKQE
jgi:hypothetical protein